MHHVVIDRLGIRTVIPIAIAFCSLCLCGCTLPTLNVDTLPDADLRRIRVIDADSRESLPQATMTCLVFTYHPTRNWMDRSENYNPYNIPYTPPDAKVSYSSDGKSTFTIEGTNYAGWGHTPLFFGFSGVEVTTRHQAFVIVAAPGYESMALTSGGPSVEDPPFTAGVVGTEHWAGSTLTHPWDERQKPRWWPEREAGSMVVPLLKAGTFIAPHSNFQLRIYHAPATTRPGSR